MMLDATSFPDAVAVTIAAIKDVYPDLFVSDTTPKDLLRRVVIVGYSGGGYRDWGEAAVNLGINVYALNNKDCRDLVLALQDLFATTSNDDIEWIATPAGGGTVIPAQAPPIQRYFVVTVHLRGQSVIDASDFLDLS